MANLDIFLYKIDANIEISILSPIFPMYGFIQNLIFGIYHNRYLILTNKD